MQALIGILIAIIIALFGGCSFMQAVDVDKVVDGAAQFGIEVPDLPVGNGSETPQQSGQPADSASDGESGAVAASDAPQAAAIDVSSWKTLGDALATMTEPMGASWSDKYYVSMYKAGDSIVRVVAKMNPQASAQLDAINWSSEDLNEQIASAVGTLELLSAEDVTYQLVSQAELDALVGKSGKDLVDEGWTFESYSMYGGQQTGAVFTKGYLGYSFTFDVSITEAEYDDGGASVMEATVVKAEFGGPSESAFDLSAIQ